MVEFMRVNIKPLSVNQAWKGKRYKTNNYVRYERDLLLLLPKIEVPTSKLSLNIVVGFSSVASDIDNFLKCFIDVLQKKYDFNDKMIYMLSVEKTIVKKGCEYIDFNISSVL